MFAATGKKSKVDGVKTEFVYADGARDDVQLSGDWNDWKAIQMFHEGGGMWSVVTPVPPGPHEFKFIVDGEWKHSNRHPTIGIDDTSLNNVRCVLPQPDLENKGGAAQKGPRESTAKALKPGRESHAGRDSQAGRESQAGRDSRVGRESRLESRAARDSKVRDSRASNAKKALASLFTK
jgi:Glycogen recognition site of AMP-activated protein kinase